MGTIYSHKQIAIFTHQMVLKVLLIARLQMTGLSIEEIAHTHTYIL